MSWRLVCLAVLGLGAAALGGCKTTVQYNVLPYPGELAHEAMPFVATAARTKGYVARMDEDELSVILDGAVWLKYEVLEGDHPKLVYWIILNDKKVPPRRRDAKLAWAKRKGDEIWRLAMAIKSGRVVPSSVPGGVPAGAPAGPPTGEVGGAPPGPPGAGPDEPPPEPPAGGSGGPGEPEEPQEVE
jgi:hypothetical protein